MTSFALTNTEEWAAHATAAPRNKDCGDGAYASAANGTRTCSGGWQFTYEGLTPGDWVSIVIDAECEGPAHPRDVLLCTAYWERIPADRAAPHHLVLRDYLKMARAEAGALQSGRVLRVPAGRTCLCIRCTLRWNAAGRVRWQRPRVEAADAPTGRPESVRVSVVTGKYQGRPKVQSIEDNIAFYAPLCEAACADAAPDLLVLPEIALQWGVSGNSLDLAVPAPGPETDVFAQIARSHGTRIVLGMLERDGDAVHNSAVLISPTGDIDGRYHKVHLAANGEWESGILPGHGFPAFPTELGRIGCNICMDSSAAEAPRMVGLNGADFLVMPIMGDLRASRFSPGSPLFNESRWLAIMRTRALDNQLCMVVARNNAHGSCIIDRKGEVLAWNEGDCDSIHADVTTADGYRTWHGGCFRGVTWVQRRPHIYAAYTDAANYGNMT